MATNNICTEIAKAMAMNFLNIQHTHLAPVFAGVTLLSGRSRPQSKSKRGGSGGGSGKGNKLKGLVQYTDVDEDKVVRLARRKPLEAAKAIAAQAPMAVWMRVVTSSGQTIMMNPDQFDAGGAGDVASATPHFS